MTLPRYPRCGRRRPDVSSRRRVIGAQASSAARSRDAADDDGALCADRYPRGSVEALGRRPAGARRSSSRRRRSSTRCSSARCGPATTRCCWIWFDDETPVGRARLHYFLINKGPWSRLDHNQPFVPGAPAKPADANFYPEGASKADVERWIRVAARSGARPRHRVLHGHPARRATRSRSFPTTSSTRPS